MPTVLRVEGFRFYFYSHEPNEPPHVHIDKGGASAKVWLEPVALARNIGFKPRDLRTVLAYTEERGAELLEAWHDFFGH
ncbi:MAG: DUF4160 domain-containing protein [Oceanicaulis sp.]